MKPLIAINKVGDSGYDYKTKTPANIHHTVVTLELRDDEHEAHERENAKGRKQKRIHALKIEIIYGVEHGFLKGINGLFFYSSIAQGCVLQKDGRLLLRYSWWGYLNSIWQDAVVSQNTELFFRFLPAEILDRRSF